MLAGLNSGKIGITGKSGNNFCKTSTYWKLLVQRELNSKYGCVSIDSNRTSYEKSAS